MQMGTPHIVGNTPDRDRPRQGGSDMRSWKTAAIVFGICVGIWQAQDSVVWGQAQDSVDWGYLKKEISEQITPDARREYDDLISQFATDITDNSIKFKDDLGKAIFIRLEDRRFCIINSCVTIVTTKCGHPGCQYASVLVPPRYYWVGVGTSFWGNLIEFPATRSNAVNTIVINNRFVAAYHAI
jgi:hypothetical protein